MWTMAKSGKDEVRSEARSDYRRLMGLRSVAKLGWDGGNVKGHG